MPLQNRIQSTILASLASARQKPAPPKLSEALEYAVLPGGARVRPQL